MPLLNGIYNNPNPVFDSVIPLSQMAELIHEQVYAARREAGTKLGSHGYIGFAWREAGLVPGTASNDLVNYILGLSVAVALKDAYSPGGTADAACNDHDGPSNGLAGWLYFKCPPAPMLGAKFNDDWNSFGSWGG
jgi:hypothetical protein